MPSAAVFSSDLAKDYNIFDNIFIYKPQKWYKKITNLP